MNTSTRERSETDCSMAKNFRGLEAKVFRQGSVRARITTQSRSSDIDLSSGKGITGREKRNDILLLVPQIFSFAGHNEFDIGLWVQNCKAPVWSKNSNGLK